MDGQDAIPVIPAVPLESAHRAQPFVSCPVAVARLAACPNKAQKLGGLGDVGTEHSDGSNQSTENRDGGDNGGGTLCEGEHGRDGVGGDTEEAGGTDEGATFEDAQSESGASDATFVDLGEPGSEVPPARVAVLQSPEDTLHLHHETGAEPSEGGAEHLECTSLDQDSEDGDDTATSTDEGVESSCLAVVPEPVHCTGIIPLATETGKVQALNLNPWGGLHIPKEVGAAGTAVQAQGRESGRERAAEWDRFSEAVAAQIEAGEFALYLSEALSPTSPADTSSGEGGSDTSAQVPGEAHLAGTSPGAGAGFRAASKWDRTMFIPAGGDYDGREWTQWRTDELLEINSQQSADESVEGGSEEGSSVVADESDETDTGSDSRRGPARMGALVAYVGKQPSQLLPLQETSEDVPSQCYVTEGESSQCECTSAVLEEATKEATEEDELQCECVEATESELSHCDCLSDLMERYLQLEQERGLTKNIPTVRRIATRGSTVVERNMRTGSGGMSWTLIRISVLMSVPRMGAGDRWNEVTARMDSARWTGGARLEGVEHGLVRQGIGGTRDTTSKGDMSMRPHVAVRQERSSGTCSCGCPWPRQQHRSRMQN